MNNVEFYVNYFVMAAESGLDSSEQIGKAFSAAILSDPEEYEISRGAAKNRQSFIDCLRTAQLAVNTFAIDVQYMRSSFVGLSKYVLDTQGKDFNTFLSDNSIEVSETYAKISNLCGIEIDAENII